ncbi:radical SAM protein [Kyrpidia sp.]|uniref:SPL family radical SAM protein n=1 Tax=Kyrpidia sp. TaxID=2073077 RepID=UPI0025889622|nr:radical SAM protein [Kyrpidia sp.]
MWIKAGGSVRHSLLRQIVLDLGGQPLLLSGHYGKVKTNKCLRVGVAMGRRTLERVVTKQTLNRVRSAYMPFSWSINPYRGCSHGCSYCYARATHTYLGMDADDTFQSHILVKENAAAALDRQLAEMVRKGGERALRGLGLVTVGTATDPYQPAEAKMKITRGCLEVLAKYGVPFTLTTRSPLILRDLDVLVRARVRAIHMSINTLDPVLWRRLEPESPSPLKRLEAVATLVGQGIRAGIFLAPILPGLTDSDEVMASVLRAAKKHDAQFAVASMLRLAPDVKQWYMRTIQAHYPELVPLYEELYRRTNPPAAFAAKTLARAHAWIRRMGIPFYREAAEKDGMRSSLAADQSDEPGGYGSEGIGEGGEKTTESVQLQLHF